MSQYPESCCAPDRVSVCASGTVSCHLLDSCLEYSTSGVSDRIQMGMGEAGWWESVRREEREGRVFPPPKAMSTNYFTFPSTASDAVRNTKSLLGEQNRTPYMGSKGNITSLWVLMVDWGTEDTHLFPQPQERQHLRQKFWGISEGKRAEIKSVLDNRHKCRVQVCLRESWGSYRFCQIQRSVLGHVVWLQRSHWGVRVLSNTLSDRTTANCPQWSTLQQDETSSW